MTRFRSAFAAPSGFTLAAPVGRAGQNPGVNASEAKSQAGGTAKRGKATASADRAAA